MQSIGLSKKKNTHNQMAAKPREEQASGIKHVFFLRGSQFFIKPPEGVSIRKGKKLFNIK